MVRVNTVIDHRADVHNLDVVHNNYCHSPEEEYQFKEMSEAVYDLKGDFQIVFLMYLNGYKYDEIAKELNIPLGTLKSRIFLARQHLQKKFSR